MINTEEHNIFSKTFEEMPGTVFKCSCGKVHRVDIEKVFVRNNGVMDELVNTLEPYREGNLLVVSDHNTYKASGEAVVKLLNDQGFRFKSFVFEPQKHDLLPDERTTGRVLIEMEQDTSFILVVGSGVLNDIGRVVSYRTHKPYAIFATAPSMDGYASVTSSMIVNGKKVSIPGKYPIAIFADIFILRAAPMTMIQAGFGDVLGKLIALADWQLANVMAGEYYCKTIARLVQKAVDNCIESTEGLLAREEEAITHLIEALLLTGICIGLAGNTRPASGTEHQLANYWDVKFVEADKEHPLHGNSVGVGTVISAMLYELAVDLIPAGISYPSSKYVIDALERVEACTNPNDLGISREMFLDSMLNARNIKKYTLLQLCHDEGKLTEYAEMLARNFYD